MAVNVIEQKAEEAEMLASAETASRSVPGDRCSSLRAPSALRPVVDNDPVETKEWLDAFRGVLETEGVDRVHFLIEQLRDLALAGGGSNFCPRNTPYVNTIPISLQPARPGDADLERSITSLIRWNALCMVSQANEKEHGIGGHIATFASAATLYEIAFHHFFKGPDHPDGPDLVYFQGHASPGFYARAFLEGRLSEAQLNNFRRELAPGGGLSSYPHPWLMPDFWQFSTVSVGLGPIMAIYQARFNRYLEHRGLKNTAGQRVWAFLGDGECDEPEALAAISLAAREKLDNLTFVINCNLQRLDGPVRGNGKIIQELEAVFYGAGWNVIKVIWGSGWDALLKHDHSGLLVRRMGEVVDGEYQKYTVAGGAYIREHFFGKYPQLLKLVEDFSDEQLERLERGGHDPAKVYAAYKAALEHRGSPTVILAHTVKGYGMGAAGEGILRGMYKMRPSPLSDRPSKAHLLGSGPILRETLRAQSILAEQFGVAADVWSVTSYKELRRDALEVERWNLLHPRQPPRQSYVQQVLANQPGVFVAASDYVRAVPEMIARWVPGGLFPLGTDGFGRSETRAALRRFFEVDAECIAIAALAQLARRDLIEPDLVEQAIHQLGVDPEKVSPMRA